jgi:hypothetical protein
MTDRTAPPSSKWSLPFKGRVVLHGGLATGEARPVVGATGRVVRSWTMAMIAGRLMRWLPARERRVASSCTAVRRWSVSPTSSRSTAATALPSGQQRSPWPPAISPAIRSWGTSTGTPSPSPSAAASSRSAHSASGCTGHDHRHFVRPASTAHQHGPAQDASGSAADGALPNVTAWLGRVCDGAEESAGRCSGRGGLGVGCQVVGRSLSVLFPGWIHCDREACDRRDRWWPGWTFGEP